MTEQIDMVNILLILTQKGVPPDIQELLVRGNDRLGVMSGALSAAIGYMRNAKMDLETGATKATAIRTIDGGIKRAEDALSGTPHV